MVFAELLGSADECFPSNLGECLALISSGILSTPFPSLSGTPVMPVLVHSDGVS